MLPVVVISLDSAKNHFCVGEHVEPADNTSPNIRPQGLVVESFREQLGHHTNTCGNKI